MFLLFCILTDGSLDSSFFLSCYCVSQIDENVKREIINHRSLRHPNIVRFKEVSIYFYMPASNLYRRGAIIFMYDVTQIFTQVILTPTHLAIVMEYASGGELFQRICKAGRFTEDEVLVQFVYFFCTYHSMREDSCTCNLFPV